MFFFTINCLLTISASGDLLCHVQVGALSQIQLGKCAVHRVHSYIQCDHLCSSQYLSAVMLSQPTEYPGHKRSSSWGRTYSFSSAVSRGCINEEENADIKAGVQSMLQVYF